ncbi:C2H2-type zinc finger domain-containing protein [Pochonia chlamydosporia 170]|uniref:C2H2-type zinc finger domain-containing protein n=1 Tax=Pochonia chlamydosporia 170 TaxID=1380566 RepID=A0A179EZI8_METCM|nr:C2H2-type zinc finger domain-containing protein [Pochonia chlamydosporia 170]OAQ58617.1 C2H2-type zinc finger domain-containing protein [Pochonia chlamydosporia 170]
MASTSIRPSNEDDDGGAAKEVYAGLNVLLRIPTEPAIRRILLSAEPCSLPKLERDSHQVAPYYKATTCDDSGYGDSSCSFSITTASIDNGQSDTVSVNPLNQIGHARNNNPGLRVRTSHKSCPKCKPERCGECNEQFSSQESLLEHFRTVHKTEYLDIVHRCLHSRDEFQKQSFLDQLSRRHEYHAGPADHLDKYVASDGAEAVVSVLSLPDEYLLQGPLGTLCCFHMPLLLRGRLWWLLEAFSAKLGFEAIDIQEKNGSSLAKHWEDALRDAYLKAAMYSTSNFGGEAISQLTARIKKRIRDATEKRNERDNSMCVSDKMRLWESRVEGSKDESAGGKINQHSAPHIHAKTSLAPEYQRLLDTMAYQWLASAVTRQASLNWETSNPENMLDEVRHAILQRLPATLFVYDNSRCEVAVTFRLPWEPIQTRLDQERAKANVGCPLLLDLTVITCTSGDEMQVTTVGQYFRQTWADDGSGLLESLQKWFDHRDESIFATTEMSSPRIQYSRRGSNLFVIINGPSYFMIQCGEQLTWLGSALQTPTPDLRICAPCIMAMGTLDFLIGTKPAPPEDTNSALSLLEQPLQLLHKQSICSRPVVGFPTANRPEGVRGLEIPWNILLTIAEDPNLEPAAGSINSHRLFLGPQITLQLVQVIEGVSLWHIVNHPLTGCNCSDICLQPNQGEKSLPIKFEELAGFRHIINTCDKVSPPAAQSFRTSSSSEVRVPDILTRPWHPEATARRGPDHASETNAEHSNGDDKFSPVVLAVVNRLLAGVRTHMRPNCTAADSDNTNNDASISSTSSPKDTPATSLDTSTGLAFSQKRSVSHRDSEDPDDDPDEDGLRRLPHKTAKRMQEKTQRTFACPFFKFDPVKHKACLSLKLRQVSRVKQHLVRNHVPQFFCPRCLTTFKTRQTYNEHIMQPSGYFCTPNPAGRLDGLSRIQELQLSKKSRHPASSERDKWFVTWAIVFPGHSPPSSPYVDAQLSEDLAVFQEHCLRAGPNLAAEEVVASGVLSVTELTDEARGDILRRAIAAGLNNMINDWSRSQLCPLSPKSSRVSFSVAQEETSPLDIELTATPADSAPENRELSSADFLEQLSSSHQSHLRDELSRTEYQTSSSHEEESVRQDISTAVHNASTQRDQSPQIHSTSNAPECASDTPEWGKILSAGDLGFFEAFDTA